MDEIAAQTLSSRKTVRRYLTEYGVELRTEDQPQIRAYEQFGTRRVDGASVPDEGERAAIATIQGLRDQGFTYGEIVRILNEKAIPSRKPGAKWHIKTVFKCLNQK